MPTPHLSIIIPAYNEEKRLPETLDLLLPHLSTLSLNHEVIIVNDGSRDRTKEIIEEYTRLHPVVRIVSHFPNQGRGVAVRRGVMAARGDMILEMDSDGSVDHEAIHRFYNHLIANPEFDGAFGSRELPTSTIQKYQPPLRVFLGKGFIYLARVLFWSWKTTDFTLGFKAFRRRAALDIFSHQHDNHYVAEAELVHVARQRGWRVVELPVRWTDNRDSRVHPIRDSLKSFWGMIKIFWHTLRGRYRE